VPLSLSRPPWDPLFSGLFQFLFLFGLVVVETATSLGDSATVHMLSVCFERRKGIRSPNPGEDEERIRGKEIGLKWKRALFLPAFSQGLTLTSFLFSNHSTDSLFSNDEDEDDEDLLDAGLTPHHLGGLSPGSSLPGMLTPTKSIGTPHDTDVRTPVTSSGDNSNPDKDGNDSDVSRTQNINDAVPPRSMWNLRRRKLGESEDSV